MDILVIVLDWILPIIGSVITILAVAGAKKLMDKWGIERSDKIDGMIDKYVGIGVNAANVAGRKFLTAQGEKMSSDSKMAIATKTVLGELEQSGIKGVAKELIENRIEDWLEVSGEEPGVSDPTEL